MAKDRRQINQIWQAANPQGLIYEYARIGSGKNSYIKTLRYIGKVATSKEMKLALKD